MFYWIDYVYKAIHKNEIMQIIYWEFLLYFNFDIQCDHKLRPLYQVNFYHNCNYLKIHVEDSNYLIYMWCIFKLLDLWTQKYTVVILPTNELAHPKLKI